MNETSEILDIKAKKQSLGIFYTPPEIVEFIFDILHIWKKQDERINKRWESKNHFPTVIDPAVGEGIFLKKAVEKGFTKPDYIFGLDIDAEVVNKWPLLNLLKEFNGNYDLLKAHFFHQNGLDRIRWEQHKYKYKIKSEYILKQQFDTVVGNPPFGGIGIDFNDNSAGTIELLGSLKNFELFSYRKYFAKTDKTQDNKQINLFNLAEPISNTYISSEKIAEYAEGIPIEILFVERFIQLAKPNGWIAIILPDGILSNSNLEYVRRYIASKTKVEAIVSLPRYTFKDSGTNAKTSILFLRKFETELNILNGNQDCLDYPVFITSLDYLNKENFNELINMYKHFQTEGTLKSPRVVDMKINLCRIFIRVDKTMKDLVKVKPTSRFNPDFWDPKFDYLDKIIKKYKAKTLEEIEGKDCVIAGDHVRQSKGESKGFNLHTGIQYYETAGFIETGYDYSNIKECSKNAYERLKQTKVKKFDILISNAGVGGVGKAKSCIITHEPSNKSCTGDVFAIRLKEIDPYYFYIFLKSKLGKDQILKMKNGVGTDNINTQEVLSICVPILSDNIQSAIIKQFKEINTLHKKAISYKKEKKELFYKRNINKANEYLIELINKVEDYIIGNRKEI